MKIVTWNVNGIRSILQKDFHDFWKREKPDILCLQETKAHPDQLDPAACALPGWTGYWSAARRPGYSGTATFTRLQPESVQHGFGIPKFDAEGRMVVTRFPEFTLFNVYFPNGGTGDERQQFKMEFLKRFGSHLHRLVRHKEKVIVVGDYNVAYLDIDVYDPKKLSTVSGFLPEERRWMTDFLEKGFVDSFRHFHPKDEEAYTWWAYYENAKATNKGWRIDHICTSQNLAGSLKSVKIFSDQGGSDHCPVMLEIDI